MQISLKLIRLINHAKRTVCIKFQLLVIFSSLLTGSSSLSVFPRGVLYLHDGAEPRIGGSLEILQFVSLVEDVEINDEVGD